MDIKGQRNFQIEFIKDFIQKNSDPDNRIDFADSIVRAQNKKYKLIKSVFGSIFALEKFNSYKFSMFANFPIPLSICPKDIEPEEFEILYSLYKNHAAGLTLDDIIFILSKINKLTNSGKKKLSRFEDFGIRNYSVKSLYKRLGRCLSRYVYDHDVGSYTLCCYFDGKPPKRSGQKKSDEELLNYNYICTSILSECGKPKESRFINVDLINMLNEAESDAQPPDVSLSSTSQAIHRLIEYGFDNLTNQPFVMRELYYLFGEKGPLMARLAARFPFLQSKIITMLKKRYVTLALQRWEQQKTGLVNTLETYIPIERSGYKKLSSVQLAINNIYSRVHPYVRYKPECVTYLSILFQVLDFDPKYYSNIIQELRSTKDPVAFPVSYEHASILIAAANVVDFLGSVCETIKMPKKGLETAITSGVTTGFNEPKRFISLYANIIKTKDYQKGPRILCGAYNVSLKDASQGISWGSIMIKLFNAYENEDKEGMSAFLRAFIFNGRLSFLYNNGNKACIKLSKPSKKSNLID